SGIIIPSPNVPPRAASDPFTGLKKCSNHGQNEILHATVDDLRTMILWAIHKDDGSAQRIWGLGHLRCTCLEEGRPDGLFRAMLDSASDRPYPWTWTIFGRSNPQVISKETMGGCHIEWDGAVRKIADDLECYHKARLYLDRVFIQ